MMNKLTKEECLKALRMLEFTSFDFDRDVNSGLLEQLINEHFDNPPLKFEELEKLKEQAIWDDKEKCYLLFESARNGYVRFYGRMDVTYGVPFEENRFFRHEVKEVK